MLGVLRVLLLSAEDGAVLLLVAGVAQQLQLGMLCVVCLPSPQQLGIYELLGLRMQLQQIQPWLSRGRCRYLRTQVAARE